MGQEYRSTPARATELPNPIGAAADDGLTWVRRRFTQFTRPVFPSPVASRMEREPSGFPLSFAPRRPEPDDARQGGDRPTEHGPETTLYDISRTSNPACLLVVCDLASHGVKQQPSRPFHTKRAETCIASPRSILSPAGAALECADCAHVAARTPAATTDRPLSRGSRARQGAPDTGTDARRRTQAEPRPSRAPRARVSRSGESGSQRARQISWQYG
jgi:hypothetical protein